MILGYQTLLERYREFFPFTPEDDKELINPASIDIRIGSKLIKEIASGKMQQVDILDIEATKEHPYIIQPQEFFLVSTYEHLQVPLDCAVELKLKSSRARIGWNHSLAFWFDPGWNGIGTMEIINATRYTSLPIWYGMRFAQIIVHQLDKPNMEGYKGRYQNAQSVETSKPGN